MAEIALDLYFHKSLKPWRGPRRSVVFLDHDEGLFPAPNYPGQKHEEYPVRFGTGGSFHLSPQDDQRLSEECVFCHELGLASGRVCQRQEQQRGGVWFGPSEEAVVERLKAKTYQPLEKGENPMHSVYYPFVKRSR